MLLMKNYWKGALLEKETIDGNMFVELKSQRVCYIPVHKGINTITFQVAERKIRANHGQFTQDGGTWLDRPIVRKLRNSKIQFLCRIKTILTNQFCLQNGNKKRLRRIYTLL